MTLKRAAALVMVGVVLTVISYGALVVWLTWPISEFSVAKSGTFGDSFGVITALFSGLAFAGIILTIMLQRQELTESREIFRIQRFEGSFYRLLELYRKNLSEIRINGEDGVSYTGIDALNSVCRRLNTAMQRHLHLLQGGQGLMEYEVQLFVEVQKLLLRQARYLGTLQSLLDLVERDLPTDEDRAPYWDIISSQVTSNEARYLFYCCLVSDQNDRLRELMHRSGLIGHRLRPTSISNTHRATYERIHGVPVPRPRIQLVTPYPRDVIKRINRKEKKARSKSGAADRS
ncbi:hypothetical protein MCC10113_2098 [Bifidobacterium longum subsp. longum]|nr:hypothetical protein MCC10113_2098 [Bifidobacterium longum subsp. longum]